MSYIIGILVSALFLAILHYTTELTTQKKVLTLVSLIAIISGAIYYNSLQSNLQEKTIQNILVYEQNRTLECFNRELQKVVDVNQSFFSFSRGTHTFIGKKSTPYYNMMINIQECN